MRTPDNNPASPYGTSAETLLRPLQTRARQFANDTTDALLHELWAREDTAKTLRMLRESELRRLKGRQRRHVELLLSGRTTRPDHVDAARRVGEAHARVGVDVLWLIEAYDLYQAKIHQLLNDGVADPSQRALLTRVLEQRINLDLATQVSSYRDVNEQISSAFLKIDRHVHSTSNLADLVRGALAVIGELPGDVSCFFARVDEAGELQIEQSHGAAAETYHRAMEAGDTPKVSVDPAREAGRGPGGRAWRSGEIAVTNAWLLAFRARPWQSLGEKLKFRSSAAIPLLDETGRSMAMLSLYSRWPGFFSTPPVRSFLMHAQQVLSQAVQRCTASTVVPLRDQQRYRRLLDSRKVVMHYQPIIGMGDGGLVKFEALARLQGDDGKLIPPGLFLPALGQDELLALFAQGLEQACNDYLAFADEYPGSAVAINLPPEGLGDPRYEAVLFETIDRCGLDSTRLHVEVLETQDAGAETAIRKPFLDRLRQAGIKITQDDLGSGHSSLLRLEKLPFDEVKIDQGLVRGALRNPKRAVEFILYLTRLAHAFDIPVTVEGLENHGLLEAAEILGADHGQGYGVARPMPADKMAAWCRSYEYPVRPQRPVTAIGAMAGYLLWDLQITGIADKPELVSEFVGARAIVDHFIDANRLRGGAIDRLVSRSHELIASAGKRDGAVKATARDRVIGELTRFWLDETSPAGAD